MKRTSPCTTSDSDYPFPNSRDLHIKRIACGKNSKIKVPNKQPWSAWEHYRYLEGLSVFGANWKKLAEFIKTKEPTQVKSHHQRVTKKELDPLQGHRQATIYKHLESNCDMASAKTEKAVPPKETCEVLVDSELIDYMIANVSIPFSANLPVSVEMAFQVASELMKDNTRYPIDKTLSLGGEGSRIVVPGTRNQKSEYRRILNSRVQQSIDHFNDFSEMHQRCTTS